ncbi:MAG: hypothetical protein WCB68_02240 [Pyrinomonadaceae bacterium]
MIVVESSTEAKFAMEAAAIAPAAMAHQSTTARYLAETKEALAEMWLPRIYRERILTKRTRSHALDIPAKDARVEIQHTLLGVELKIGRRRIMCPDLATARYLGVFARAGCTNVAVPYDITQISRLADELESSWHRMLLLVEHKAGERGQAFRTRLRSLLISDARKEIMEAGAGTAVPQFNQNTRQRRA